MMMMDEALPNRRRFDTTKINHCLFVLLCSQVYQDDDVTGLSPNLDFIGRIAAIRLFSGQHLIKILYQQASVCFTCSL